MAVPRGGLKARVLTAPGLGDGVPGRRSRARTGRGRTTGARVPTGRVGALHLPATVRAAAPHQASRGRLSGPLRLRPDDLREAVREGREGNLVLFVVDASGSMGARQRMTTVKDAVLALLTDAYQRRDKVGGDRLPGRRGADAAAGRPRRCWPPRPGWPSCPPVGVRRWPRGCSRAADLLRVERLRDPQRRPLVLVVTDGRATAGNRPLDRAAAAAALAGGDRGALRRRRLRVRPGPPQPGRRLATQLGAPNPLAPSPTRPRQRASCRGVTPAPMTDLQPQDARRGEG